MLDVLSGKSEYVRPHPPVQAELPASSSFAGEGLSTVFIEDFVVCRGGRLIYNEAKSAAPGGGDWTVAKLEREGILEAFRSQISQDLEVSCRLITPSPCPIFQAIDDAVGSRESQREFEANLSAKDRKAFGEMCSCLDIDGAAGHSMLKACHVDCVSMAYLERTVDDLLEALIGGPGAARDVLFALAMEAMANGSRVDAVILRERLADKGVYEKPPATVEAIAAAFRNASAVLEGAKRDTAGVHIEQPAVREIAEWVGGKEADERPYGVLLDQAGMGKTASMSSLLSVLEDDGWAVLGIKADAVGEYATTEELRDRLSLPAPIPAAASALVHAGRKVAVLIDQVDALSTATARDPNAIAVILDTVARLSQVPDVRVVLSCRSFDWEFDVNIRQLRERHPHKFGLKPFDPKDVERVLATKGIGRGDLHPLTRKVLETPQHLDGFIRLVDAKRSADPAWSPDASHVYTLQSLYEDLWSTVLRKAGFQGKDATAIAQVAEQAAADMQEGQCLAVPVARLDENRAEVEWLVSEAILLLDGRTLRFFHQTFFDFMVARGFVRRGASLTDYLVSSDQGLFFRPLVKQVLQYLRDTDRPASRREVTKLLNDDRIRRHLKRLVYEWLGQLRDAEPEDLVFHEPMLSNAAQVRHAFSCMMGNAAWLDILTPERLRQWLWSSADRERDAGVRYLASVAEARQQDVIPLLAPLIGRSKESNGCVAYCLQTIERGWSEEAVRLLSQVTVDPQTAVQGEVAWWDDALLNLANDRPAAACTVVFQVLSRLSRDADSAKHGEEDSNGIGEAPDERFPRAYGFWEALKVLAHRTPSELLRAVLPATLEAMKVSCRFPVAGRFKSSALLWDYTDDDVHSPARKAAFYLVQAVFRVAETDPEAFRNLVPQLTDNDLAPLQRLVADAYARRPEEYAEDAAQFLLADVRRLRLGTYDSEMWTTRQLIASCSTFWSEAESRALERAILEKLEDRPRSINEARWRGMDQLELLGALDEAKLTADGRAELGQLRRKFPDFKPRPRGGSRSGLVGPPIADDAIARMNDRGWLGAMTKYVDERPPREWGRPIALSGGRRQLSQALERRAKEEPSRFHRLAMDRMDDSYHPDYVGAILRGIAEGHAPVEMAAEIVGKFRAALERSNIRDVTHALRKYSADEIAGELEDLVKEWAVGAPDPATTAAQPYTPRFSPDCFGDGINTDRGSCVCLLGELYSRAEPRRMMEYLQLADAIVTDSCPSVRAVCLRFLAYAIPADPARACRVFRELLGSDRTALLRTRGAGEFIYYSRGRCTDSLLDVVEEMISDTGHPETQQRGANLACLSAFREPTAEPLRDRCLTGSVAQRTGAAQVYAANLRQPELAAVCQAMLQRFWRDESTEVRAAACWFIHALDANLLRAHSQLIRDWMSSPAFTDGVEDMARELSKAPCADPQLTIELGRKAAQVLGQAMADIQRRAATVPYHLIPAIVSLYHASEDPIRSQCMDILEDLDELGCYGIAEVYQLADRF
jgi:hypothetical protein